LTRHKLDGLIFGLKAFRKLSLEDFAFFEMGFDHILTVVLLAAVLATEIPETRTAKIDLIK
jgi:hypothetical protein